MSRAGYTDDADDNWAMITWRGAVASAIRGKRGQSFLREMLEALDAMPEKRLIAHALEVPEYNPLLHWLFAPPADNDVPRPYAAWDWPFEFARECGVCAIGSVGARRGVPMARLDPEDYDSVAGAFGIAGALVREIEYENDEGGRYDETPEQRWTRVRQWVLRCLGEAA